MLNGSLIITITDITLPDPFVLVNASKIVGNFTAITINQPSTTCFSAATSSNGGTLAVLFSQPSGPCDGGSGSTGGSTSKKDRKLTAILAGSIGGGVLLVAFVLFLLLMCHRKQRGHWIWASVDDDTTISI